MRCACAILPLLLWSPRADAQAPDDSLPREEAVAQQAGRALDVLGQAVIQARAEESGQKPSRDLLVLPEPWIPPGEARFAIAGWQTVYQNGALEVREAANPTGGAPDDAQPFPHALAAFLQSALPGRVDRCSFKVIDVEGLPNDRFATKSLVAARSRKENTVYELDAVWRSIWSVPEEETLHHEATNLEQCFQTALEDAPTLFSDLTTGVLELTADDRALIANDNYYWRNHIEAALLPDPFGWNGIAVADLDGNGLEDVYLCHFGGLPNQAFMQETDGSFTNRAAALGLDFLDNSQAALFVDLDNDGDQDLALVSDAGVGIFENAPEEVSTTRFVERLRFPTINRGYSITAADIDRDRLLDLYVCQYYASGEELGRLPAPYPIFDSNAGGRNHLLRNLGDCRFRDETTARGLDERNNRFSYAAVWDDFDRDGDPDLFVSNDFGKNNYYRNDAGRFTELSDQMGLDSGAFGMSACTGDYDRDGWADVYISNMFSSAGSRITRQSWFKASDNPEVRGKFQHLAGGNTLMRNDGGSRFIDVSAEQGVTMGRWSWCSLFADLNNDGWEDLLVTNGMVTGKEPEDL